MMAEEASARPPRKSPRKRPPASATSAEPAAVDEVPLRVVGVGASAGGLEALQLFLGSVPPGCGLAFVVIQHMDPHHEGMLVELLQRVTEMPVAQITDALPVEPDQVYVIPPNRDVSLRNGLLHLSGPTESQGLRLPIDFFFRSLADDLGGRSVGVVLSGMGSDGTLGLRAIREHAGAGFVQEPASAKFDGMPSSAITAGVADVIAPAGELPARIVAFVRRVPAVEVVAAVPVPAREDLDDLDRVIVLLRTLTGKDFSHYKKTTMLRRIERRMGLHELASLGHYAQFLRNDVDEPQLLFQELLIGVTNFFRDPLVWDQLRDEIIPELLAHQPDGGVLRAWVAGCSTGEEAYSLAITFREALDLIQPESRYSLQIFATDIDATAIDRARAGVYSEAIVADVGEARLRRYFVADGDNVRVVTEIREMVIFAVQNVISDPPFTKLDLLTCRNLLIYLDAELQKRLIPMFHYSLNPGGVLLLGSAEADGDLSDLFTPLAGAGRLYTTKAVASLLAHIANPDGVGIRHPREAANPIEPIHAPTYSKTGAADASMPVQAWAESVVLQRYAPTAVATDIHGDIVYVIGQTARYLEIPAGTANWNVFAMARSGLEGVLRDTFARALRQREAATSEHALIDAGDLGIVAVDITVETLPAADNAAPDTVLIVFAEIADVAANDRTEPTAVAGSPSSRRVTKAVLVAELAQARTELERCQIELERCRQEQLAARDATQAAQQELRSTSEEMQSANEELQSANEELNTSKEEMQSMNEELLTVNNELHARVQELAHANDDTTNLFNSTAIAALFLDDQLNVRRFTPTVTEIVNLIPGDVGRPMTDLVSTLDYPGLVDDIEAVMRTLIFHEDEVTAGEGQWFRVRIMPYRTQDNRIDGVVITFVDSSESHLMQAALREALSVLEDRFTRQGAELDDVRDLDAALRSAQTVLEARLADQAEQLSQSRTPGRAKRGDS